MSRIRVLFLPPVDAANTNAQSLNTREIALRLDTDRFESTLLYSNEPDSRLLDRPHIRLLKLPAHGKTWAILKEERVGHDIIAYMDYSPAGYLLLQLPRSFRRGARTVFHAEAPIAQMTKPSRRLRFLSRGILSRCDIYTGITDYVARDIALASGHKVAFVLPVGVDCDVFRPPHGRQAVQTTVLFVGTLVPRKGADLLLDAAVRFPGVKFRLIGSGRDGCEDLLRQKVEELKLQNVSLEGAKSQAEVAEAMRQSDIFLLPSRLEGLPRVTLEAAATGLPCMVFCDYETPSVVDGVTGYQVRTKEEMIGSLGRLIGDSALRCIMGMAARKHAEKFDWSVVAQQWDAAYWKIAADADRAN